MEDLKEANDNWKFWIAVIIVIKIIGFAAVICARRKLYKHIEKPYDDMFYRVEKRYWEAWEHTDHRTDDAEFQITETYQ